jgi:hypothetical protein
LVCLTWAKGKEREGLGCVGAFWAELGQERKRGSWWAGRREEGAGPRGRNPFSFSEINLNADSL